MPGATRIRSQKWIIFPTKQKARRLVLRGDPFSAFWHKHLAFMFAVFTNIISTIFIESTWHTTRAHHFFIFYFFLWEGRMFWPFCPFSRIQPLSPTYILMAPLLRKVVVSLGLWRQNHGCVVATATLISSFMQRKPAGLPLRTASQQYGFAEVLIAKPNDICHTLPSCASIRLHSFNLWGAIGVGLKRQRNIAGHVAPNHPGAHSTAQHLQGSASAKNGT